MPKARELYWASQGKEGFFKFVHLPPGRYLLVVNSDDKQDPEFPYPRTFYPAVHDRDSAKVITLQGGEQLNDLDIRVKPQFTPRHLLVRVSWADGRLIKDHVYVDAQGTEHPQALAYTHQPDARASLVELSLVPNEPYKVYATVPCQYGDERSLGPGSGLKTSPVYLGAKDERTELTLAIPAMGCPKVAGKTVLTEQ